MPRTRSILLVRYEEPEVNDDDLFDGDLLGELDDTKEEAESGPPQLVPLGTCQEVQDALAQLNIFPEQVKPASGETAVSNVLYGPGITIQLPLVGPDDEVNQLLVSITDDMIAWAVIMRVCSHNEWRMMEA